MSQTYAMMKSYHIQHTQKRTNPIMLAVLKIVFIYINHLYVSTAAFLTIPTLYMQSITKERRVETGKLTIN